MQSDELERRVRGARRAPMFALDALPNRVSFGRAEIERLLPHRGSMLLLDGLSHVDPVVGRLAGHRRVQPDDPVFQGHFPDEPIYPGVLQVEMSGQLGLCVHHFLRAGEPTIPPDTKPAPVRLVRVRDASFVAAARPGDALSVLAELVEDNGYTFTALGQVLRDGQVLSASLFEAIFGGDENA